MLQKTRRLTAEHFKQFPRNAATFHTPLLVARVSPTETAEPTRFGVVISQKVAKKAVDRHRLKRRVHGAIERCVDDVADGSQVVLYMKQASQEASTDEIVNALWSTLKKAGLLS